MSTDYTLLKRGGYELSLWEGSSQFTIMASGLGTNPEGERVEVSLDVPEPERLTADEVVDIALKMLQPVLYNVRNPSDYLLGIVKKVAELVPG